MATHLALNPTVNLDPKSYTQSPKPETWPSKEEIGVDRLYALRVQDLVRDLRGTFACSLFSQASLRGLEVVLLTTRSILGDTVQYRVLAIFYFLMIAS